MTDDLADEVRMLLVKISEQIMRDKSFFKDDSGMVQTLQRLDGLAEEALRVFDSEDEA